MSMSIIRALLIQKGFWVQSSSVAHVMLGFYCGMLIRKEKNVNEKVIAVFVVGTVLVVGGYLLSYGLPLNKRIWSPSYVMMTCGLASLLQAFLMYVIDIKGEKGSPGRSSSMCSESMLLPSMCRVNFLPFC